MYNGLLTNTSIITLVVLVYFIILLVKNIRYSKKLKNEEIKEKAWGLNEIRTYIIGCFIIVNSVILISLGGIYGLDIQNYLYLRVVNFIAIGSVGMQLIADIVSRAIAQKAKILNEDEKKEFQRANRFSIIKGIIFWILVTVLYVALDTVNNAINLEIRKPIIYLYPEQDTQVSISFENPSALTTTYPKYNDGWNVLAMKDSTLIGKDGRKYYALYWEGLSKIDVDSNVGFCVKGENIASFLEEKLETLGLNERESEEFIIYWLPILEKNPYNYIYFMQTDEVDSIAKLNVEPAPDSKIRVLMVYKPLDREIEVEEQEIITPRRDGFTLVEWGGSELSKGE